LRPERRGDILRRMTLAATRARLAWLTLWAAAFGLCEGAVVVYLRRLCYPDQPDDGPLFPLRIVEPLILRTEQWREAGTLLVLLGVALLAERRPLRRFAVFAFSFGIWDLAYYATLHVALGWPASLMDWDVLFLIPAPWSSPVLAPVLVSLALVGSSSLLLHRLDVDGGRGFRARDWLVQIVAGALIVASMLWNAGPVDRQEQPGDFPWWLFLLGLVGGIGFFLRALKQAR
jgi:hypothetical protein